MVLLLVLLLVFYSSFVFFVVGDGIGTDTGVFFWGGELRDTARAVS